jgi:hypothetical protein
MTSRNRIESMTGTFYRTSQYAGAEEAKAQGGLRTIETVYGTSQAIDTIINMCRVAKALDYDALMNDIKVRLVLNGLTQDECYLGECYDKLNEFINA